MKRFLTGLALGFALALLLAPVSGEEARAAIRARVRGARATLPKLVPIRRTPEPSAGEAGAPERHPGVAAAPIESRGGAGVPEPRRGAAASELEPPQRPIDDASSRAVEILNSATAEQLMTVRGIGRVLATRIIQNRPYESEADFISRGILQPKTLEELKRELLS